MKPYGADLTQICGFTPGAILDVGELFAFAEDRTPVYRPPTATRKLFYGEIMMPRVWTVSHGVWAQLSESYPILVPSRILKSALIKS
jgi:hypothetical protein